MKPYLYSLIAVAAACGLASAQTTAYTTPVGYVTLDIPAGGSSATPKLAIASQQLLPPGATEFAGVAESFSGTTLNDAEGTWSAGSYVNPTPPSGFPNYTHLVEITGGPLTGTYSWITASASGTLTTYDNISAAGTNVPYRIVKAFTLATLIPGNPPATSAFAGGTSAVGDNLLLFNSDTGAYTTFYYKTSGGGGTGWRTTASTSINVASVAIHPTDSGLVIQRKNAAAASIVITGDVKTGPTDVLVRGGGGTGTGTVSLNIIQTHFPVNQLTLGSSGLYTGSTATGLLGGTSSVADNVLILNPATGTYTTYYYKTSGGGGTGWRSTASTSISEANTPLPSNSAILIQRKANGTDFTWEIPAVNIPN